MATATVTPQANQQSNVNVMAANEQARRLLVRRAVEMTQEIYSNTVTATNTQILNIVPRNVGVIKRFIIEVSGTITNQGTAPAQLQELGLPNLVSNVTFYDLQNNLRINTTGEHLYMLSSVKRQRYWLSSMAFQQQTVPPLTAPTDNVPFPGSLFTTDNQDVLVVAHDLAAGASAQVRMFYEVPLAYSDQDLRGAVFANVVNTTMQLQITLATQLVNTSGDYHGTMYYDGASGSNITFDSATVTVYQVYLDQLPSAANGQLILPNIDLATVYEIKNTTLTGMAINQEFPIPYANFRDFFSVLLYYWPGTRIAPSAAINYFNLTTANFTNIYKYDVHYAMALGRDVLRHDLPPLWFYFSSRTHPIWTTQFGNQQLNFSPLVADAGAYALVHWESMALQNTLVGSASLPAGG